MNANLVKKIRLSVCFFIFAGFFLLSKRVLFAQNCNLDIDFKPSAAGAGINWAQFPEFTLPFKVVYGGPVNFSNPYLMFRRGFTHVSNPHSFNNIDTKNRAYMIYNVSAADPLPPFHTEKNPWGNDLKILEKYWDEQIRFALSATQANQKIDADLFLIDVERQIKSDEGILELKKSNNTPNSIKNLSDADFIAAYKKALQELYAYAFNYYISKAVDKTKTKNSAYGDPPIFNTFINIQGKTWPKWKTDANGINFLTLDFAKKTVGGPYYNLQNFISPSAYFYFDYPHPFAGEYLSYLLFQIESNRVWSNKDQMVFLWQKYSYTPEFVKTEIKPFMAESMGIFSFMAGAKGVWLWEDPSVNKDSDNYSNYEYFTKGLYRLSKFSAIINADYTRLEPISGREYNENKLPIWRGLKVGNNVLIAAHNPWAKSDQEIVNVQVKIDNKVKLIPLKGFETHLCQYSLADFENAEDNFNVYPNPTAERIKIELLSESKQDIFVEIVDENGRILKSEAFSAETGLFIKEINLKTLNGPLFFVNVRANKQKYAKKIIKN
jgi:hypothetical protein